MRKGSIATPVPANAADIVAPLAAQSAEILVRTSADALVALTLEQSNPEYTLSYLSLIAHSHHPEGDAIAKQVCEDPRFLARLQSADGNLAGVVLAQLSSIRYSGGPTRVALGKVYATLIDRVPTSLFPAVARDAFFLEDENKTLLLEAALRRLPAVDSLTDLDNVLDIITSLSADEATVGAALVSVDWGALRPPITAERDEFELWAARFSQVVSPREQVLEKLLSVLDIDDVLRVYGADWYGVRSEGDSPQSINQRMSAKTVLLRELVKRDIEAALATLKRNADRDFQMFFSSPLVMWNEDEPSPARGWFDAVSTINPLLAEELIHGLLLHVSPRRDPGRLAASAPTVERFVANWLRDNGQKLPRPAWDRLLERLDRIKHDDYDGAAAIAAIDLASEEADRSAFLEAALPKVKERMRASGGGGRTESVAKLRNAIEQFTPHLLAMFDSS